MNVCMYVCSVQYGVLLLFGYISYFLMTQFLCSLAQSLLTICYQTETCGERVTSVNVFTEEKCHLYRIIVGYVRYVGCLSLKKYFLK
jgi:hypothetical protein